MNCKNTWDFDFLAKNTDEPFHNHEYREYRAKIIIQRERSLLPATQPYVESVRVQEEKKKQVQDLTREIAMLRELLYEAIDKKNLLRFELKCAENSKPEISQNIFIGNCPNQDCKGYLDNQYICGICKEEACSKCREQKHEKSCNPDILKTIRLLSKDTKSCPNCGIPIHKIEGCDQMFCTSCHTPFGWNTGKIETGRIHNPHYYEYQRKNGGAIREAGDVQCGGAVSSNKLRNKLIKDRHTEQTVDWVMESHRLSGHIRSVVIPLYRAQQVEEHTNRDLRIKYLLGALSEKRWISEIKKREKKREKNTAISLALLMFVDTIDDLHANIVLGKSFIYIPELKKLQEYIQSVLKDISVRFQNKVPSITKNWGFRKVG
jgi:hypothetical protein